MLEVTCNKCGNRYTVKEDKLPAQGARIRCPNCASVFLVRPNKGGDSVDSPRSLSSQDIAKASMLPEDDLNSAAGDTGIAWRVRNAGMTLEFHDLKSLQEWMGKRASVEGVKVAKGEDEFKELGDYEEVLSIDLINKFFPLGDVPKTQKANESDKASSPIPSVSSLEAVSPAAPANDMGFSVVTASKQTMKNIQKSRHEESNRAKKANSNLKIFLVAIFMLACVGLLLYELGIIDMKMFKAEEVPAGHTIAYIDGKKVYVPIEESYDKPAVEVKANDTAAPAPKQAVEAKPEPPVDPNIYMGDEEEIAKQEADETEKLLSKARESIKKRNWPFAQTILVSIISEQPGNIEAKELLVKVYRALGKNAEAEKLEADIKAIKYWNE